MNRECCAKLVVFCGPPCAGKSTLAAQLSAGLEIEHLSMDRVRKQLIPASDHQQEDIDVAYRAMHFAARLLLERGHDVIIDGTYGRYQQRRELEGVAEATQVPLFLIQCQVSPQTAVGRFKQRAESHPAIDLTDERVALLAESYPYCSAGLLLATTASVLRCLDLIHEYLAAGRPARIGEWSDTARRSRRWPGPRTR